MNFKRGDILRAGDQIVQLMGEPRWDYYYHLGGGRTLDKRWLAQVIHLEGPYKGRLINQYHLEDCVKSFDFNHKKVQKHKIDLLK